MSALISVQNGVAEMVSGRGMVPWHKLGTVVEGLLTAAQALQAAHLDWRVLSCPVSINGQQLPYPEAESESNYDTWQGITRADNGKPLGVVRGRYNIIQNQEAFEFFDHLIGQGKAVYDTAGALRDGRQVWLLAKVDGEIKINGDEHRQFALMVTSHDGSYALQVCWVTVRVVCNNTLTLAVKGAQNVVKIRHTASWQDKEAEAARVLGLGEHYFKTIQDQLAGMNDQLLTPDQMSAFTEALIPATKDSAGKVPTRTQNIRDEINRLFADGDGNHGRSRWDALNAVTDYADHFATIRGQQSTRLESALLGSAAQLKQKAFELLTSEDLMADILNRPITPKDSQLHGTDFARLMSN